MPRGRPPGPSSLLLSRRMRLLLVALAMPGISSSSSSSPTTSAVPCRAGTYPTCYPGATARGWACVVKSSASKDAVGKAIQWACGAGGVNCSAISGAQPPGPCWDPTKPPSAQDETLFGNFVLGSFYAQHCVHNGPPPAGSPCPGPGSASAGACSFGGAAELVRAPVAPPCTAPAAATGLQLAADYTGEAFFDAFEFFTGSDPTQGWVRYVNETEARARGLAGVNAAGQVWMRADNTTTFPPPPPSPPPRVRWEPGVRAGSPGEQCAVCVGVEFINGTDEGCELRTIASKSAAECCIFCQVRALHESVLSESAPTRWQQQ
jgi:hypothetical protein